MAKPAVYDASAIQALKGLEPVRRMPGMYTHTVHPLHIVQEAIDNAVDEALAGFGKKITVTVRKDHSVEVQDEGRGIPVDMHPVEKKPAVEVAFTMLHEVEGKEKKTWKYERGMEQYFEMMLDGRPLVAPLFTGERFFKESNIPEVEPGEGASWAIGWVAEGDIFADSHVNLIPTRSGGTH